MIGSFWNLCRACPSMPIDKLHSEYRSTYKWHEYTGPRQDVVRHPPQANTTAISNEGEPTKVQNSNRMQEDETESELPKLEPALPRRKKHPDLAYRHHAFLTSRFGSTDVSDSINCDRARHRGWGAELANQQLSELYDKQTDLWNQVSQRSSLSALSLASTAPRLYTKEEKERENNKRSVPTNSFRNLNNSVKAMKDMIRHHLERTTGGTELDGLILSPTREKLEPTIPKKGNDCNGTHKGNSPKCSPQKFSPHKIGTQKRNNQKEKDVTEMRRPQSVGPSELHSEKLTSTHQSRSASVKDKKTLNSVLVSRSPRPSADSSPKSGYPDISNPSCVIEQESTCSESVVKSPPEPTRVKSPEQILMRSPDPVNWTVPLDTGKTFTVTQNIREGDIGSRPQSEIKAWTPPDIQLPADLSTSPHLTGQINEQDVDFTKKA